MKKFRIISLFIFLTPVIAFVISVCLLLPPARDQERGPAPASMERPQHEPWRPYHGYFLSTAEDNVVAEERQSEMGGISRRTRYYRFPDGDYFYQQRLEYLEEITADFVDTALIRLSGSGGSLRYWDAEDEEWVNTELADGYYPARQYFVSTSEEQALILPPLAYLPRENDMLEALPGADGRLTVESYAGGYCLRLQTRAGQAGTLYDYFYLTSPRELVQWTEHAAHGWSGYNFTGDNRWTIDGYYYTAPSDYIPSGQNYYHRLPAAYIVSKLPFYDYPAGRKLAIAMLDVMLQLQNEQGFFPTNAGSNWLLTEYGIGPGFYDTRFNSDLVEALLEAAEKYGVDKFAASAFLYGQYFLHMANLHHYTLTDADGSEGWLVYDYSRSGGSAKNHCSLNHQLAEIIVLYRLWEESGDTMFIELAQKMLKGLTIIGSGWIMDDDNLYYAYYPDGSMGGRDYPYLTYNDLYRMQECLYKLTGEEDAMLARLMRAKKGWMDENGVKGYIGYAGD